MIKIGDTVEIIAPGNYYPSNSGAARKLKAKKWIPHMDPKKGDTGIVKSMIEGEIESGYVYLVDLGENEVVIGERGVMKLKEWDDDTN